jgi:hypothetical protein
LATIWCAISGHGFGHAAQVVPVLNELGRHIPGLAAILATTVPHSFFEDRVTIPWSLQSRQQDIGCVQNGPLAIDVPATWEAYRRFHDAWEAHVVEEMQAMKAAGPALVLADTPYVAVSAAKRAGIPSVVLANFTWNEVLAALGDASFEREQDVIRSIRHSYGNADMALRVAPGLPLSGISKVVDIGPIAEPALSERERLRSYLGISPSEQLVLVAFGGIPLDTLPWDRMVEMKGYQFLLGGLSKVPSARIHSLSAIPFSFKTALASVDVVMTKPGYGTILEAVALGLPVVYVRRYTFADEAPLVEFLHKHGQGLELSRNDFVCGNWRSTFEALADCKKVPTPPPMTGAADAAQALVFHFQ